MNIERIMSSLEAKHPGESEYLQAVKEVLLSIEDIYNQHPEFEKAKIIERLVEPDRIFTFRVTGWTTKVMYKPTLAMCAIQQCHWPVQRRHSFPCICKSFYLEVLRI